MGKFCSQCGRPLEEGEVCNCQHQSQPQSEQQSQTEQQQMGQQSQTGQQSNAQQQLNQAVGKAAEATKALAGKIVPILKNPVEELKGIAATGDSKLGIQMVLCNIIASFLLLIIGMIALRLKLGDMAEYMEIPYVKIVLVGTIVMAAYYFAMAGILFGFTKAFAKGSEVHFAQSITAVGGKALYDIAVFVLGALCMVISSGFGLYVIMAGMAFTYLLMVITYSESVALKGSFKVYVLAITYICMMVLLIFAMKSFAQSLFDTVFAGSLGNLFSGIGM